jgi:hypothetical protein
MGGHFKILILALLASFSVAAQGYVQPMGYKDYSFWGQVNIGNNGAKLTHPSAYLEVGKRSGSTLGVLFPRGNKDSVPIKYIGLVFDDIATNSLVRWNGSAWEPLGAGAADGNNYLTSLTYASNVLTANISGSSPVTVTLPFSSKLNISDTASKWVTSVYSRGDSVFYKKGTTETFVFADSAFGGSFVPTSRILTINSVPHDLDSNQSWGPFLVPNDTVWIHNKVMSISNAADSSIYTNGLYKTVNQIGAHYEWPIWNANRLQSFYVNPVIPGNGYFLGFDSLTAQWRPMRPDSVVGGGGGSTPTLQQVTDAGNTTTNSMLLNGATLKRSTINSNIAFGKQNLGAVTTGKMNVAIGDSSLTGITTGSWNTAVGYQTLESTTTANGNTAIGRWALESTTTGSSNTAVGVNAGDFLTTGGNNTALGDNSAQRLTTGSNNILIGSVAGASIRTGQYNTIIGALHSQTDSDYSHHIVIGDGQYERLLIDSVGLWKMDTYGTGAHTGTATYGAAWDANGKLIEVATGGGGGGGGLPYQLLSIFMTQSGTSAPTITTLYNGVTGCSSVTATRAVSGGGVPAYTIHLNGISGAQGMTFNKTTINGYMGVAWNGSNITSFPVGDGATVNGYVWMYWASIGTVELYCTDASGTAVEFSSLFDSGQQLPFEIKIYP